MKIEIEPQEILTRARRYFIHAADNLMTQGLAWNAQDMADIAGIPKMEEKIVLYRAANLAHHVIEMAGQAKKTNGAFNILKPEGLFNYAAATIALFGNSMLSTMDDWRYYPDVWIPFAYGFDSIPDEIIEKMESHLILNGIPKSLIPLRPLKDLNWEYNHLPVLDLLQTILTPAVQMLAVDERYPVYLKTIALGLAYSGLLFGYFMQRVSRDISHEHQTARGILDESGASRAQDYERKEIAMNWLYRNAERRKYLYLFRTFFSKIPELFALGTLIVNKGEDALGVSTAAITSLQALVDGAGLVESLTKQKLDTRIVGLAAEYLQNGPYLANDLAWKRWASKAKERYRSQKIDDDDPDILYELKDFQAEIGDAVSKPITATIKAGHIYHITGESGAGKSIFLYALRGLARNRGLAYIRNRGTLRPLEQVNQKELGFDIAYYTVEGKSGKGQRVVDLYMDNWFESQGKTIKKLSVAEAMILPDASLERQLFTIWMQLFKSRTDGLEPLNYYGINPDTNIPSWESNLFGRIMSLEDFKLICQLRLQRIEYAKSKLAQMGTAMDFDPRKPVEELSTGMRARAILDNAVSSGANLIILDEPFGNIDSGNVSRLMEKWCDKMKQSNKKFALAYVSHTHNDIVAGIVKSYLGEDKYQTISL